MLNINKLKIKYRILLELFENLVSIIGNESKNTSSLFCLQSLSNFIQN